MQTARLFPECAIKIVAQAHLQRFYGRFGFEAVGDLYDEDCISHIHMISLPVKLIWQRLQLAVFLHILTFTFQQRALAFHSPRR